MLNECPVVARVWQFLAACSDQSDWWRNEEFLTCNDRSLPDFSRGTSVAEELSGRIVITKKLSKKLVRMPAYQLRGISPVPATDQPVPVSECSEVVGFLDGASHAADKPVRAELQQKGQRFEPQLLVVPAGSTVHSLTPTQSFTTYFSFSRKAVRPGLLSRRPDPYCQV
jgi:hypothetical protein